MKNGTDDVAGAEQLARDLVRDHLSIRKIEWLISDGGTPDPRREAILEASYPRYVQAREEWEKILNHDDPVFERINELRGIDNNAYAIAGFHLGFAAAKRLLQEGKP